MSILNMYYGSLNYMKTAFHKHYSSDNNLKCSKFTTSSTKHVQFHFIKRSKLHKDYGYRLNSNLSDT